MVPEPFYFGRREHLFGLYHPALNARRGRAVVICPPLLNEYMRSHHLLRRVALKLATNGYDVLRFDFSGQGNSAGATQQVSCAEWAEDVDDALAEIEAIANVESISVVAVRFACSLVAGRSSESRLRQFVCWDPIFDGAEWYRSLQRVQRKLAADDRVGDRLGSHEYMGYEMGEGFAESVASHRHRPTGAAKVTIVHTQDAEDIPGSTRVPVEFNCRWEEMSSQVLYSREIVTGLCQPFA